MQRRTRVPAPPRPDRRRPGILPGRRLALGVMAGLGLLVLPAAGAVADDSAPLVRATVYNGGGGTTTDSVSPAQLRAAPSQCPTYSSGSMQEYGRQGPVTVTPSPTNSWTMATILGCLETPIALADVTGITVIGGDGAPLTGPGSELTPADLATPSGFQNPAQTPVVTALGSTDQYDRPWRGGSDLDYLDETQSTPIAIEVFEGPPLKVTAAASQTTVTVGSMINFSAAVSGNNGASLSYSWNFGGGAAPSTQAAPQVQFATAGVWTVNVEVTSANGGGGGDQVTVTVTQPGSTTTPTTTGPTTTGPDKSSGPTPGGEPVKQKKSGTQPKGTQHTHGTGNKHTSTNSQTTTTQTTTTQTTTTPAAGSSGGSSGSSGSSGGSGSTTQPTTTTTGHKAPPAPTHRPAPPVPASGTLVRGQLVSDVVPLPANQSPLVHVVPTSSGGAPARQAPERPSVLPIIGAALAIMVLLGLGAQRELGRPRWWPPPRTSG
ncbi:MAG: PKD domain-containing protein [Solirubrobacteraceae bacterium]